MAQSPGTTNIAADEKIVKQIRAYAKKNRMKVLDLTNALLRNGLATAEIEIEIKKIKLLSPAPTKTDHKSAR